MSPTGGTFTPSGWISNIAEGNLERGGSIAVVPNLPQGTIILGLTILPIHIYSNDPHPEPFPGLVAEFVDGGRSFILRADPYNPRDSIQFYEWQVTYGQAPAGYHPTGWISGVTGSGTLPQRIAANVPRNKAPAGATILPIHIYSNDPNPEPFPGLRLDITNDGNFWIYEGGGGGARDSIQFYEWQMLLAPADAAPARPGWISGVTQNATIPVTITPLVPEGKGIVSVTVLPIHIYSNDPKPEPWPGLRVSFPTRQTFTIHAEKVDPRDGVDWFEWQVTYADLG
jgi:hypothetical protein